MAGFAVVAIAAALKWGIIPSKAGGFIRRDKDPTTFYLAVGAAAVLGLLALLAALWRP